MPENRRSRAWYWLTALLLVLCIGGLIWFAWFSPASRLPDKVPIRVERPT
jgi:hypothetical protein